MKKILIFPFLIHYLLLGHCFGTQDSGQRASFIGFNKKNDYALVIVNSIYVEPDEDEFEAKAFLIDMGSCSSNLVDVLKISDKTGKLSSAYFEEELEVFWDYYRKQTINKKFKNIEEYRTKVRVLKKTKAPKKVKISQESYTKWKKSARFHFENNKTLIVSQIKSQNGLIPTISLNNIESKGQLIETALYPSFIYYSSRNKYIPSELDAYVSNKNSVIVVGSIADKPEFNASFFPFWVVWPNKNCN